MRRLVFSFTVLLLGCTDPEGTRSVLQDSGYRDIRIDGYSWFACDDKSDTFATAFHAISPTGHPVSGAVCKGWRKGKTIRFD